MMVNMQALIMLTVAGYCEAMADRATNKLHLMNQAFVLLITYHLYQFTEFMTDLQTRDEVALSLVVITLTNVALNLGVLYSKTLVLCFTRTKLHYFRIKGLLKIRKQRKLRYELFLQRRRKIQLL